MNRVLALAAAAMIACGVLLLLAGEGGGPAPDVSGIDRAPKRADTSMDRGEAASLTMGDEVVALPQQGRVEASPSGEPAAAAAAGGGRSWSLRFQPRFPDVPVDPGATPGIRLPPFVVHAAIAIDGGARSDLPVVQLQDPSTLEAIEPRAVADLDNVDLELATLVLAVSPFGLQAGDGRVFFGATMEARGGARLVDAVSIDRQRRMIDLGEVELVAPTDLGHVVFRPELDSEHALFAGIGGAPAAFASAFESRALGRLTELPAGTRSVRCSSFREPGRWFATVRDSTGTQVFHGNAARGTDIVVALEQRMGVDVTIDLVRHPDAARVLLMRGDEPLMSSLKHEGFIERVRRSVRSAAIPMPKGRVGKTEMPIGLMESGDGFARVELWGLKDSDGVRWLLASQPVSVSGDLTAVRL